MRGTLPGGRLTSHDWRVSGQATRRGPSLITLSGPMATRVVLGLTYNDFGTQQLGGTACTKGGGDKIVPEKIWKVTIPKGKQSENQHFSGAMLNFAKNKIFLGAGLK